MQTLSSRQRLMVPVYRMERSVKRSWKRAWIWKLMFVLAALTSVHVLERSSICTRVLAAQTYSMSEWLLRPFSKEKEKKNINSMWELRKMHMMSSLPSQYLFYLCCMLLTTWLHPFRMQSWKATRKTLVFRWFPTVVPVITDSRFCWAIW